MRVLSLLLLVLAACSDSSPSPSSATDAGVDALDTAPFACGSTTCTPPQLCFHSTGGAAGPDAGVTAWCDLTTDPGACVSPTPPDQFPNDAHNRWCE